MTLQIEAWHLITLSLTVFGGYWALAKIVAGQAQRHLDARFKAEADARNLNHAQVTKTLEAINDTARRDGDQLARLERDLMNLRAELPERYVRREDYVRGQSTIEAKLDALATKFENALLRIMGANRES